MRNEVVWDREDMDNDVGSGTGRTGIMKWCGTEKTWVMT